LTLARVTSDPGQVDAFIAELVEAYYRGPAQDVKAALQSEAPMLTGAMRASHTVDPPRKVGNGWLIRFRVEANNNGFPYPIAVHNGRGVVRPVRKKALRWVSRSGVVVFATRSRPSRPNPWMWRTFTRIGFRSVTRPFT
jgi:hypothetical protein